MGNRRAGARRYNSFREQLSVWASIAGRGGFGRRPAGAGPGMGSLARQTVSRMRALVLLGCLRVGARHGEGRSRQFQFGSAVVAALRYGKPRFTPANFF